MLALIRALYRATQTGDDTIIARSYLRLAARIGSAKAQQLAQRFLRSSQRVADSELGPGCFAER